MVDAKFNKKNSSVTPEFIIDSSHVSQKSKVWATLLHVIILHAKLKCYNCENDLTNIDATCLYNIGKTMAVHGTMYKTRHMGY